MERFPPIRLRRPGAGSSVPGEVGEDPSRAVVLIEDHGLMRQSQRRAVEADPRLSFAGEAADGRAGIQLIRSRHPDVAAVDLRMEPVDGWGVLEAVRSEGLGCRVVFVSAFDDPAIVQRALNLGAAGFVSKGTDGRDLCELLLRAVRGQRAVSRDVQEKLLELMGSDEDVRLSPRELDVLRCLATGKKAGEIGESLHLSTSTVRSHISALHRKLEVSNSTAAVAEGFRRGLID